MASTLSKEHQQKNADHDAVVAYKSCVRQAEELVGRAPEGVMRKIVAALMGAALEARTREPDFEAARSIVATIVRGEARDGGT